MENTIVVNVCQKIGSPSALTAEKGKIIYDIIIDAISRDQKVILDFSEIQSSITPFFNAAIGKLYEKYDGEKIKLHLSFRNFPDNKVKSLNLVIKNAKRYYKDKKTYESIAKGVMEG